MKNKTSRRSFLRLADDAKTPVGSAPPSAPGRGADRSIRLGFIGVGDRGSWHLDVALGIPGVEVPALCDINDAYLYRAKRWVEDAGKPTPRLYGRTRTDWQRLIEEEDLDAVICCTSWEWHAPVAIAAMKNGKHCVNEVPMIQTLDEAWEVVETHEKTGKWATLGFKGVHSELSNMIHQGVFGEIRHIEGGYVHDLRLVKFDPEREPWRLQPSVDRNGNLYPDHPTARTMPLMDINHGDRFESLLSLSSKAVMLNRYADLYYGPEHPYATKPMQQGDYNATLIRTVGGKLYTLNFDTNTPHPREEYRLQGTKGVLFRQGGVGQKIYLEGVSPEEHRWEDAEPYFERYKHPITKNYDPPERAAAVRGHGSRSNRTPLEWTRLVDAIREDRVTDFDVYDSVTSSAITPLSEESVALNGRPVEFPDFTRGRWKSAPPHEVRYQREHGTR